jgi:hypothetical protein
VVYTIEIYPSFPTVMGSLLVSRRILADTWKEESYEFAMAILRAKQGALSPMCIAQREAARKPCTNQVAIKARPNYDSI